MKNKIEEGSSQSDYSVSFWIKDQERLAIAELSILPIELAKEYIEDTPLSKIDKEKILEVLEQSNYIYFFNRLNVPRQITNQGHGSSLLLKVKHYLHEKNGFLINTASAYGEKSQKDLIIYYEKNGLKLIKKDGLMIYHSLLNLEANNKIKKKI